MWLEKSSAFVSAETAEYTLQTTAVGQCQSLQQQLQFHMLLMKIISYQDCWYSNLQKSGLQDQ